MGLKIGKKPKPESPDEMRMVHHALANPIRRKLIIMMTEGVSDPQELARAAGPEHLDYHMRYLEEAGLVEMKGERIHLTESGIAYGNLVRAQREAGGADRLHCSESEPP